MSRSHTVAEIPEAQSTPERHACLCNFQTSTCVLYIQLCIRRPRTASSSICKVAGGMGNRSCNKLLCTKVHTTNTKIQNKQAPSRFKEGKCALSESVDGRWWVRTISCGCSVSRCKRRQILTHQINLAVPATIHVGNLYTW